MSNKIQQLLESAERQARSSENGESSVTFARRTFSEATALEESYVRLKQKLYRVREWNAASALTSFELFEENGALCTRKEAAAGDFIRLSLAGSGKDDWVKISEIFDAPNEVVMRVKPTYNPTANPADKTTISHFFGGAATNNFCLEKSDATLSFYVIGLSEKTNTEETENLVEKIRNFATSNVGYYLGIQKSEWQTFCENFLELK